MNRRSFIRGAIIAASTPATIGVSLTFGVDFVFNRFEIANAAWLENVDQHGDIIAEGPIYDDAWSACKDVVMHQCSSPEEVQRKIDLILSDKWLTECAMTGYDESFGYLTERFLRSLKIAA